MKNYLKQLLLFIVVLSFASCSKPLANFIIDRTEVVAPAEVQFENQSKNAVSYKWDFGDGNESTEASPTHRYLSSGNYEVTLVALDEKGKHNKYKSRMMVTPPKKCLVEVQTDFGNMVIELFDDTPKHRDNFFKLTEEGFFDGLLFHRVIEGFMIQGGDPNSRNAKPGQGLGAGGPGYTIHAEITGNPHMHIKGSLAAARQPDNVNPQLKSSGSQFYIVQGKKMSAQEMEMMERRTGIEYTDEQKEAYQTLGGTPFLDGQYTVFGRVVSGLEVIDKIASVKKAPGDRPIEDLKMTVKPIK